jgi:hypothetical protein
MTKSLWIISGIMLLFSTCASLLIFGLMDIAQDIALGLPHDILDLQALVGGVGTLVMTVVMIAFIKRHPL